uniref:NADH dehydrogenase [ubiquinone] 1 beta subcomplex subunit 7 n=1 Tax=Noccaea caerulescens TaxID=107243 RepID=A0A1J3JUN4_NOCCA
MAEQLYKRGEMQVSRAELFEQRIPLPFRDYCAHLLIPLNKCRHEHLHMKWACEHEKHEYETCHWQWYKDRMAQKKALDEAAKDAAAAAAQS